MRRLCLVLLVLAGCGRHHGHPTPDAAPPDTHLRVIPSEVKQRVDQQEQEDQKRLDKMAEHPLDEP